MRSWFQDHRDDWVSFGAWSNGNPYGIPDGLYYSFPVTVRNKQWSIVQNLDIT
jgi:malate/lactate dehydrogenase